MEKNSYFLADNWSSTSIHVYVADLMKLLLEQLL